jgi:hypothetical protein
LPLSVEALIHAVLEEADLIDELIDNVVRQRELVKNGDYAVMQEFMKDIQDGSFRIQAQENQRSRLAVSVAKDLGCEPRLSTLVKVVPEEMRSLFMGAGERLRHSVFALKSEMAVLSSLIEQNERFSAMLLSEWRRLDAGFMRSGGLDFRG